jgi:hypothetical protein
VKQTKQARSGFHFQPFLEQELTQTDNAPLLFTSHPPGRRGRVTLFVKTRRTLRKRLGVHDVGQLESVLQDKDREIAHEELQSALTKRTRWRYLFPPEVKNALDAESRVDSHQFRTLMERALIPQPEAS